MGFRAPGFDRKPHSWYGRSKQRLNRLLSPFPQRFRLKLSPADRHGPLPGYQQWLEGGWKDYIWQTNLVPAVAILLFCIIVMWLSFEPLGVEQPLQNLWIEFGGLTFDVFFILVVFSLFEHRRQNRQNIERQKEIIGDYKHWDSEEARFRIAGALRRLSKRGIHAIDFCGAKLSDFSFSKSGIETIRGSNFYDGVWGEVFSDNTVKLQRVEFSYLDCREVVFSPLDPFADFRGERSRYTHLIDCDFYESNLQGASFNGAVLKWTETPPDDLYEYIEDEYGQQALQHAYGPFDKADLSGASFVSVVFVNADFRNAKGILAADFKDAKGLEGAQFDTDEIKSEVLKMTQYGPKKNDVQ